MELEYARDECRVGVREQAHVLQVQRAARHRLLVPVAELRCKANAYVWRALPDSSAIRHLSSPIWISSRPIIRR